MNRAPRTSSAQRGGAALLLVFVLLAAMTAAAMGATRNLIREFSMAGDALQGSLAACAADTGVDWFRAWAAAGGAGSGLFQGTDFALPEGGGAVPCASTPGGLQSEFTLRATRLGPVPSAGEAPPEILWRVAIQGRSGLLKEGKQGSFFYSRRELIVALPPPGEEGVGLRLRAWRTVW